MMQETIIIEIRSKHYAARTGESNAVLRDMTFRIEPGELVCIVGPSGAGKSTLLNLLAGVDPEFNGRIQPAPSPERTVGVVFQQPRLMPWLTVSDNALLACAKPSETLRQRASAMLAKLGLDDVAEHFPGELSLGMQRRVALVRALLPEPDLLLLDEAFVSLDSPVAENAREVFREQQQRTGAAAIVFTHDLREAVSLGQRLLFLSGAPARVALEVAVNHSQVNECGGQSLDNFCQRLMQQHPGLLSGQATDTVRLAR